MVTLPTLSDILQVNRPYAPTKDPFLEALQPYLERAKDFADPWHKSRREAQTPPDWDWQIWLQMAGRGFGKTRTGAEWSREKLMYGNSRYFHFIAPTAADARDVMVEGPAGFIKACEPYGWQYGKRHGQLNYEPSKTRITCPNGAEVNIFSAEEPERLRGPQCHDLWADEIGTWKNAQYCWDMAMFGLRLGDNPQALATTTPRPTSLVKSLVADERSADNPNGSVAVTGGSTYENRANLAKTFIAKIIKKYEGTRLGEQELLGKLLLDIPGALWSAELIELFRIVQDESDPDRPLKDMDLYRMAVGVDPMVKDPQQEQDMDNPSETGIVVAGLGPFDHLYVMADESAPGTPHQWATAAVRAYHYWRADHIVAEVNNGGMMVKSTIESIDPNVPVVMVRASRGKYIRAEPISAFYEQGRAHHVGTFPKLEDQMTTFTGDPKEKSPDRLDALVWAATDLMVGQGGGMIDPEVEASFDWPGLTQWG